MKKIVIAAAALAAAAPAYAQEAPQQSPFTGARVEGRVGFDRVVATIGDGQSDESEGESGVVYGGEAGFDFDLNSVVVGAYAGIEGSSVKISADGDSLRAGRNITVGGRIGFLASPTALIYAKGGYSNGQLRLNTTALRYRDELDGFHLGAGGEVLFGTNLYGKLEYVYTNYSTGIDRDDFGFDLDLERHQVVAGLGVRF